MAELFQLAILSFHRIAGQKMPTIVQFIKRIHNVWQRNGWSMFGPLLIYNLHYHGKRLFSKKLRTQQKCSVDQIPGVETHRLVSLSALGTISENSKGAQPYQPITEPAFNAIVQSLPIDPGELVFVDLGSGKGRALLLAAKAGFHNIVGVEYSQELHLAAKRNMAAALGHWPNVDRIQLILGDAIAYDPPAMGVVLYLYNPFDASVMAPVIEKWCAAMQKHSHALWVVYVNPTERSLFEKNCSFQPMSVGGGTAIFSRTPRP